MSSRPVYVALGAFAATLLVLSARSAMSSGQSGALVRLQADAPGTVQTGNLNISGRATVGQIVHGTTAPGALIHVEVDAIGSGIYAHNQSESAYPPIHGSFGSPWDHQFYSAAVRGDSKLPYVHGVSGQSETAFGVAGYGEAAGSVGVSGYSSFGTGGSFSNNNTSFAALYARNFSGGLAANLDGQVKFGTMTHAVAGAPIAIEHIEIDSNTTGIFARTATNNVKPAIYGIIGAGWNYQFFNAAVRGDGAITGTMGVAGHSVNNYGVVGYGETSSSVGVYGYSNLGTGGKFENNSLGPALSATNFAGGPTAILNGKTAIGANFAPSNSLDVRGTTADAVTITNTSTGRGVHVVAPGDTAVWAETTNGFTALDARKPGGLAAYFNGNISVTGTVAKGGGSFKIDHPLDPQNKYLYHSFVESPDMKNIYDGVVTTDAKGYATVTLPEWFDTLNRDFRYQLTVLDEDDADSFVMAKVVRKIKGNQFTLRTSAPNVEVSWMVTGIRQDDFANAHRIPVEQDKEPENRGLYLYPEEAGVAKERGIDFQRYERMRKAGAPKK